MFSFFFFNDTATTEIYTLSLHDALPIYQLARTMDELDAQRPVAVHCKGGYRSSITTSLLRRAGFRLVMNVIGGTSRSEEHTSELQSLAYLVCRLLLAKKKTYIHGPHTQP